MPLLVAAACGGDGGPSEVEDDPCLAAQVSYPEPGPQDGTRYAHDPEVAREGSYYYVYSTNDGIPIRRSADLVHWTFLGRVFPNQVPSWAAGTTSRLNSPPTTRSNFALSRMRSNVSGVAAMPTAVFVRPSEIT